MGWCDVFSSIFQLSRFFEVEKFSFLTGKECVSVGHCEAHTTSSQTEIEEKKEKINDTFSH